MEDYAAFRKGFDGAEDERKSAGALSSAVYQSVDDPNEVIVEIEFSTTDAAKAYMNSEELRERQQRASKQPTRMLVVNKT
jgi:heme-degrading monooxygenase HmoA